MNSRSKQILTAAAASLALLGLFALSSGPAEQPPPHAPQQQARADAPPQPLSGGEHAQQAEGHREAGHDDHPCAAMPLPAPGDAPPCGPLPGEPEVYGNCIVAGLDELVEYSDRIYVGTILSAECRRGAEPGEIYTYYTLEVQRTLKGAAKQRVELRVIGGSLPEEDVVLNVTHQPEFVGGETGVVFIDDDPRLYTSLVASQQGFLFLEQGQVGQRPVRDGFGRSIQALSSSDRFELGDDRRLTEAQVLRRIRELVG